MNDEISRLQCTQCGGELHPDEGQLFVTCPFCNSTIYLDKSHVAIEAERSDKVKSVDFTTQLSEPNLWILPL